MSAIVAADGTVVLSAEHGAALLRWQTAVALFRSKEQELLAAREEADAAVVELAKFATTAQGAP